MFSSAFNCRHILFHISSCKKENENSSYSANDSDSQKHTVRGGFFQNLPSNERGNSGSQSEAHIKKGLGLAPTASDLAAGWDVSAAMSTQPAITP